MRPLPTSTVGSFPKPAYLRKARRDSLSGKVSKDELAALTRQATKEIIALQEEIGIDVLVDGEMDRGDMVGYFAERLPGMVPGDEFVRSYGNRYYRKPAITDEVAWGGPMTVDLFRYAQGLTEKPVKGMLTGPYTIVEWSFDEHYPSREDAVLSVAKAIHREARALADAGAKYIQVDEPAIHTRPDADFETAVKAMGVVVEGIEAEFQTHICYGDVPRIYPGMLRLDVDQIHIAFKNTDFELLDLFRKEPFPASKALGLGVLDVHDHRVEDAGSVRAGILKALDLVSPDRLWIEPDCGLKTRTEAEVRSKLKVMVETADAVREKIAV